MKKRLKFLTEKEAAKYLKKHPTYMECLRRKGIAPKFYRVGSRILYLKQTLDDWETVNESNNQKKIRK